MTDIEQAFNEICDQLGCAYDNEAALFAIDKLQKSAQSAAEPVRPAWVEPDEDNEGKYVVCVETPAQVEMFEVGAMHFAGALAKAINEHVKLYTAPPRPDVSAGLIEAAEFTDQMFSLSFDRCHFDSYEIMELGERLGLLEQVLYNPKIHDGEIDADEGDMIYVRSAKGKAIRARAADGSTK